MTLRNKNINDQKPNEKLQIKNLRNKNSKTKIKMTKPNIFKKDRIHRAITNRREFHKRC